MDWVTKIRTEKLTEEKDAEGFVRSSTEAPGTEEEHTSTNDEGFVRTNR
jgi:hypothetical protein